MERKFYIDRLRIFLTVLVIFHHAAIAFGASGGWYYTVQDKVTGLEENLMSLCMTVNQSYFMSLFFLISAFFMPTSYDRKGFKKFISDRLLRLGIPLLVYTFVINPLLVYCIYYDKATTSVLNCFQDACFGVGPMWFVLTLLIFEISYALYRKFCSQRLSTYFSDKFPPFIKILIFIIFTGLVAFAFRLFCPVGTNIYGLQIGYFSLYIFMYLVGILACRKHWFDKVTLFGAKAWLCVAIVGIFVLVYELRTPTDDPSSFLGGYNTAALFYAMWEPWMCVSICYVLLAWFKNQFNAPSKVVIRLSGDSFPAYIIHPVMVVGMTFVVDLWPIDPVLKIFVTTLFASILAFGVADILKKIPCIKCVL